MDERFMSTKEAAAYLGINEVHFRRSILPEMKKMKLKGMGKLGKSRNASWRFKQTTLDEYIERGAAEAESEEE
jgi:hypothetical protein